MLISVAAVILSRVNLVFSRSCLFIQLYFSINTGLRLPRDLKSTLNQGKARNYVQYKQISQTSANEIDEFHTLLSQMGITAKIVKLKFFKLP